MRSPTDRTEITWVDLALGIGGVRLHTQKNPLFTKIQGKAVKEAGKRYIHLPGLTGIDEVPNPRYAQLNCKLTKGGGGLQDWGGRAPTFCFHRRSWKRRTASTRRQACAPFQPPCASRTRRVAVVAAPLWCLGSEFVRRRGRQWRKVRAVLFFCLPFVFLSETISIRRPDLEP
jgi:hypothetical protein